MAEFQPKVQCKTPLESLQDFKSCKDGLTMDEITERKNKINKKLQLFTKKIEEDYDVFGWYGLTTEEIVVLKEALDQKQQVLKNKAESYLNKLSQEDRQRESIYTEIEKNVATQLTNLLQTTNDSLKEANNWDGWISIFQGTINHTEFTDILQEIQNTSIRDFNNIKTYENKLIIDRTQQSITKFHENLSNHSHNIFEQNSSGEDSQQENNKDLVFILENLENIIPNPNSYSSGIQEALRNNDAKAFAKIIQPLLGINKNVPVNKKTWRRFSTYLKNNGNIEQIIKTEETNLSNRTTILQDFNEFQYNDQNKSLQEQLKSPQFKNFLEAIMDMPGDLYNEFQDIKELINDEKYLVATGELQTLLKLNGEIINIKTWNRLLYYKQNATIIGVEQEEQKQENHLAKYESSLSTNQHSRQNLIEFSKQIPTNTEEAKVYEKIYFLHLDQAFGKLYFPELHKLIKSNNLSEKKDSFSNITSLSRTKLLEAIQSDLQIIPNFNLLETSYPTVTEVISKINDQLPLILTKKWQDVYTNLQTEKNNSTLSTLSTNDLLETINTLLIQYPKKQNTDNLIRTEMMIKVSQALLCAVAKKNPFIKTELGDLLKLDSGYNFVDGKAPQNSKTRQAFLNLHAILNELHAGGADNISINKNSTSPTSTSLKFLKNLTDGKYKEKIQNWKSTTTLRKEYQQLEATTGYEYDLATIKDMTRQELKENIILMKNNKIDKIDNEVNEIDDDKLLIIDLNTLNKETLLTLPDRLLSLLEYEDDYDISVFDNITNEDKQIIIRKIKSLQDYLNNKEKVTEIE